MASWLSTCSDVEVVGEFSTAEQAVDALKRLPADVLLLDVDIPGSNTFETARRLRHESPSTRLVYLSGHTHDRFIECALESGAVGFITKAESTEAVAQAIRDVFAGGVYFSPEIRARIVIDAEGVRLIESARSPTATLTPREMEVLRYIARGMAKKEIASVIKVGTKTVEKHTENLMRKLDIHDRVELARFAIREQLVRL